MLHFTAQHSSLESKDDVRRKTIGSNRNRENW